GRLERAERLEHLKLAERARYTGVRDLVSPLRVDLERQEDRIAECDRLTVERRAYQHRVERRRSGRRPQRRKEHESDRDREPQWRCVRELNNAMKGATYERSVETSTESIRIRPNARSRSAR